VLWLLERRRWDVCDICLMWCFFAGAGFGRDNIDGWEGALRGWYGWGYCNVCNRVIMGVLVTSIMGHGVCGEGGELVRCDCTIIDYLWGISSPSHPRSSLVAPALMALSSNASIPTNNYR
jgi:hypothetical protein